jgi:hypothetical protein
LIALRTANAIATHLSFPKNPKLFLEGAGKVQSGFGFFGNRTSGTGNEEKIED